MALSLLALRENIATQLHDNIARETNCYPQPAATLRYPCITVMPGSPEGAYVSYYESSFATATVRFTLELLVAGSLADAQIAVDDYLSSGTGNASSIINAQLVDPTFGGLAIQSVVRTADVQEPTDGPLRVLLPLEVTVRKR